MPERLNMYFVDCLFICVALIGQWRIFYYSEICQIRLHPFNNKQKMWPVPECLEQDLEPRGVTGQLKQP